MVDIIIKEQESDILIKDCPDFVPLNDGTITGEKKYCNLSLMCKQIGMDADYVEIRDTNGNVMEHDYFCTGRYLKKEERLKDEEAS